jgi:hypothetical protein
VGGIAISYRREDTAWITGRIFDRLKIRYETRESDGDASPIVFMDYDSTPVGVDFRNHIMGVLDRCEILLAIIGPRWFGDDGHGRKRIMEETDWVRIEIEYALKKNIPVVPVLIDRTPMPPADALPPGMRDLVYRQAAVIDTQIDFNSHIERLIRQIDRHPGIGIAEASNRPRAMESGAAIMPASAAAPQVGASLGLPKRLWLPAVAALCVAAVVLLAYFLLRETRIDPIYAVYRSAELGVTVAFPHNILSLDNTERIQRRLTLRDANGVPLIRISRTPLPGHKDITQGRQQEIDELAKSMYTVTYIAPEKAQNWSNWYVLSGVRHGTKFYFRRWYADDSVVSMEFIYPPTMAPLFDQLIPTMTREFAFSSAAPQP